MLNVLKWAMSVGDCLPIFVFSINRHFAKSPFGKGERSNFSLFERKVTKEANKPAA